MRSKIYLLPPKSIQKEIILIIKKNVGKKVLKKMFVLFSKI